MMTITIEWVYTIAALPWQPVGL